MKPAPKPVRPRIWFGRLPKQRRETRQEQAEHDRLIADFIRRRGIVKLEKRFAHFE